MSDELPASPVYTRQLAGISKLVRAELDHPRIVAVRAELAAVQCLNPSGCLSFVLVSESAEHRAADDWA